MAEEETKKEKKTKKKEKKKKETLNDLKIAYRSLEDPKKFYKTVLIPMIIIGLSYNPNVSISRKSNSSESKQKATSRS